MSVILLIEVAGQKHPLSLSLRPLTLGRSKKCNVRFADNLMSSRHCEISLNEHGRVMVKDLNSTNGTFINDIKIEAGYVFLNDVLRVGNINITIDRTKLTPSEREKLVNDEEKVRHRFVDYKEKPKNTKTEVVADFSGFDNEGTISNDKTFVMNKDEQMKATTAMKKQKSGPKSRSKRKEKLASKDKSGIFKKLLKSFKKD